MKKIKKFRTHKWIEGWEGFYSVGPSGSVYSYPRVDLMGRQRKGRFLSQRPDKKGVKSVILYRGETSTQRKVHRLVAAAFCMRWPGCNEVTHKNGNVSDNRASNLAWMTRTEIRRAYIKRKKKKAKK